LRLRPLAPTRRLSRALFEQLAERIKSGKLAPGARLPTEEALTRAAGVSRTVVREAVKSLVAKGLLRTGPKVGTRVLPAEAWNWFDPDLVAWQSKAGPSSGFLRDLQELRSVVEPAGVRLAAQRATAKDIAEIESAFAGMVQAVEQGGDYITHDLRFHQGLLRASHNRMLMQMSKAIGALLRVSFELSTLKPGRAGRSLPQHRAVLDAVIARDPKKAERAILVLIDDAGGEIERVLGSRRKLPSLSVTSRRLLGRAQQP
jgi:DNA-binding FadR family transcriptional regulator